MKRVLLSIFAAILFFNVQAQVSTTTVAGDYKIINIGTNTYGDYTHALILLHQVYNGTTLIEHNYAIGTITAMRGTSGSYNRINVVNVNTSSAYSMTSATINSYDDNSSWGLKTCIYNGNMYLAVDIPYADAFHGWGYQFSGWTTSTGENMKCVPYLVNGVPVNTTLISNIQDFSSNMAETHNVATFNVTGGYTLLGGLRINGGDIANSIYSNSDIGITTNGGSAGLHILQTGNQYFTGGNVGIGTTSPMQKLTVLMDGSTNGAGVAVQAVNNSAAGSQPGFALLNSSGTMRMNSYLDVSSDTYNIGNAVGATLMTINQSGNVAIGTINVPTGYKLAVAGNAIAESMTVKLQANWPDVVFKKKYALMPLSEVKTYIDKNQHLPEIPAAAEVEKDGVNLGEMNRLLVKKVEELTLYLIEKDKEIKDITEKQQVQSNINKQLAEQLKAIQDQLKQQKL